MFFSVSFFVSHKWLYDHFPIRLIGKWWVTPETLSYLGMRHLGMNFLLAFPSCCTLSFHDKGYFPCCVGTNVKMRMSFNYLCLFVFSLSILSVPPPKWPINSWTVTLSATTHELKWVIHAVKWEKLPLSQNKPWLDWVIFKQTHMQVHLAQYFLYLIKARSWLCSVSGISIEAIAFLLTVLNKAVMNLLSNRGLIDRLGPS